MKQDRARQSKTGNSKETRAAVVEVIETIRALNTLYKTETDALERSDTKAFMAIQRDKLARAQAYQNKMAILIASKHEMKAIDPALKNTLKGLQKDFQTIAKKNVVAIERMQRCTEKLGNRIRNAAVLDAQQQRSFSYSETGEIPNATQRKVVSTGLSETV